VLGAAKPISSVTINRMFGAPLGGITSAGQYGFDSVALGAISPRNGCIGFGRYLPSMVVVEPDEPGVPVTCWPCALNVVSDASTRAASHPDAASCLMTPSIT
jgi:hypothetical protein